MKQFLFGILAVILAFAFIHPAVQAQLSSDKLDIQSTQAVAFVKPDRSILYIKRPDQPVDAYDFAALVPNNFIDSIRHIGFIGMTPAGDRIILGASIFYQSVSDGQHYLFNGILSAPWPATPFNLQASPIIFLRSASHTPAISFRPAGVMSADGSQWYAVTSSYGQESAPLIFYHGRTDGAGSVDSAVVTGLAGNSATLSGNYQVSNLTIDPGSNTMLATTFDGLSSQLQSGRALFYTWNPGANQQLSPSDFTGSMKTFYPSDKFHNNFDSVYGLTVQPGIGGSANIGLTSLSDNSIIFCSVPFGSPTITVSSSNETNNPIPRSAIPSTENFFAGPNCPNSRYSEDLVGNGVGQCGNSGDVNFNSAGDKAVFITHESSYACSKRDTFSAIWTYDFTTNSSTMIYNDTNAQELQPVFVTAMDTIPHTPYISSDVTTKDFGSIDTATTSSKTITFADTSSFAGTILDSATITGQNASDFTITTPIQQHTLLQSTSLPVSVTFAPTLTAGSRSATLTLYSSMTNNPPVAVTLTGKALVKAGGGVSEDPALQANIAIDPNPFASQTSIRLTAHDAGTLGIIVHDALGRTVYTSDIRRVNAGATETFAFDAKSLGLANGIYIVTGLFGDRSASREVVLTK